MQSRQVKGGAAEDGIASARNFPDVLEHGFGDMAVSGQVPVNVASDEVLGVHGLGRLAADEFRE